MPRAIHIFRTPDRFVAGTVGEPGERSFYLQAVHDARVVSVLLHHFPQRFLDEFLQRTPRPLPVVDLDETLLDPRLEPPIGGQRGDRLLAPQQRRMHDLLDRHPRQPLHHRLRLLDPHIVERDTGRPARQRPGRVRRRAAVTQQNDRHACQPKRPR